MSEHTQVGSYDELRRRAGATDGFNESDHPRAENGQFGSGGGKKGGSSNEPRGYIQHTPQQEQREFEEALRKRKSKQED